MKQSCYYNTSASLCQRIQLCQELPIYWHFVVVNGGLPSSYFTFFLLLAQIKFTPFEWKVLKQAEISLLSMPKVHSWRALTVQCGTDVAIPLKICFCVEGKWKLRLGCSSSHFWRWRGWGLCICVAFMPMKASILIEVRVCHYAKADSQEHSIHLSAHVVL